MEAALPCREAGPSQPRRKRRRKRRRRCKRHPSEGPHSPNCRASTVKGRNTHNLVRTLPTLQPMLDFLDVSGEVFTREQIMGHLIEYIKQKALFDPKDPRKVYCQNDQLSIIFGCKEFSTANACQLLLQNLETVPLTDSNCSCSESDQQYLSDPSTSTGRYSLPSTSAAVSCLDTVAPGAKRRRSGSWSDASNVADVNTAEAPCCGLYFSPFRPDVFSEDGEEFCQHYQRVCDNATDVVTDTSDDLFFLNETDDEPVILPQATDEFVEEYEPITFSEEEQLIALTREYEDESSSDDTETDEGEDGGDELDEDEETDSEIEEDDKWNCESCGDQNHPMTRNCRKCWNVRKDWYPTSLHRSMSDPAKSTTEQPTQVEQLPDSDTPSTSHAISGGNDTESKCVICLKHHANGCIVHGQTGHQVCCVGCAKKLKENGKPCPVCRKKIQKVITNFT